MSDREVIRRHSKSFALASRLLPPASRRRAEALYVWCRVADDWIDHASDREAATVALAELGAEVTHVYAGYPAKTPAGDALQRVVQGCRIPVEYPLQLLAGLAMDVHGTRYETQTELLLYCHRVAGVVGLMMCHALGVTDDAALRHAAHLGIGMQLTNIARDVAEDWERGRLYLPREWLARVPQPGESLEDELLAPAVRRCLDLADRYYESGEEGLRYLSPRCQLAIRTAARVYRAIGQEIAARGYRPSRGRAVVSTAKKLNLLVQTALNRLPELVWGGCRVREPEKIESFVPLAEVSAATP
jgi:phytoene synthase